MIEKKSNYKKIALITGGTRGIGKAIVKQLIEDGFFVIVNYRKDDVETKQNINILKDTSTDLYFLRADVSNEIEVSAMFNDIKKNFKKIDVVISNAAIIDNKNNETLENVSLKNLEKSLGVNFFGGINVIKKSIPFLKKSDSGRIIFVNSVLSFIGTGRRFSYITSKTINLGVVKALTLELAPYNICVNAIVPGYIKTRMSSFCGKELENKLCKIPLKKLGEVEDVANLVSFLSSEKSNYITGQHIHVNGGLYLS